MIYLEYGTWNAGTLTWSAEQALIELRFAEYPLVTRNGGRDLQEIEYRHTLSKRSVWDFAVSADELYSSTKLTFMKNFFLADAWRFSLETDAGKRWTANDATMREVIIEDGKLPVEFIEGNKHLPEITTEFIQKTPS